VLFGGRSAEHDISVISAQSIMAAMDPDRYEVVPVGITREGGWLTGGDPLKELAAPAAPGTNGRGEGPVQERKLSALSTREAARPGGPLPPVDVVFPVLHGPLGEDGTVQGMLELAGLPYVGAGVLASAVGMDKEFMKRSFRAARLPIVPYLVVRESEWARERDEILGRVEAALGYPVFAKPANLGSSVGISRADDRAGLNSALDEALRYDAKALVERAVEARELECGVLGNEAPEASRVGEIVPAREFYDYEAKYSDMATRLIVPADLPRRLENRVRKLAVETFKSIDGAGMARVDFFLERPTGRLFVNEINTIPGCTPVSMFPRMWAAAGLDYPALVERLIQLAFERHERTARYRAAVTRA
jgi:D-alanine-D-alanine ligase